MATTPQIAASPNRITGPFGRFSVPLALICYSFPISQKGEPDGLTGASCVLSYTCTRQTIRPCETSRTARDPAAAEAADVLLHFEVAGGALTGDLSGRRGGARLRRGEQQLANDQQNANRDQGEDRLLSASETLFILNKSNKFFHGVLLVIHSRLNTALQSIESKIHAKRACYREWYRTGIERGEERGEGESAGYRLGRLMAARDIHDQAAVRSALMRARADD
jgi:hypothetical protein